MASALGPRKLSFLGVSVLWLTEGCGWNFFPMAKTFVNIQCLVDSLVLNNMWARDCLFHTEFLSGFFLLTQQGIFSTNSLKHLFSWFFSLELLSNSVKSSEELQIAGEVRERGESRLTCRRRATWLQTKMIKSLILQVSGNLNMDNLNMDIDTLVR